MRFLESEAGDGAHCLAEAVIARHGVCCSKEPVLPRQRPLVPETGRTAGSTTLAVHSRDCLPCRPVRTAPLPGKAGPSPGAMDPLGDHALACSRTGLLARRAKVVERAWVRVAVLANLLYFQDVPLESSGNLVFAPKRQRKQAGSRIDWRFRAGF